MVFTTSKVLESLKEYKTEYQLRVNDPLSDNERTDEKVEEYFNISKQTIDKMKAEYKILRSRIAVAKHDIREKDATIKLLRAQLCERNKEPNINSPKLCHENSPSRNPRESMYKEKNDKYYPTPARKAFQKFEAENLNKRRLVDTINAQKELDEMQTTSSIHPTSESFVNNYLSNDSPPWNTSQIKGKLVKLKVINEFIYSDA